MTKKTIVVCEIGLPANINNETVNKITQILSTIRKVPNVIYVDSFVEEVEEEE